MRSFVAFALAALINISSAADPTNYSLYNVNMPNGPAECSSIDTGVSFLTLGAIDNALIKCWMSPGILIAIMMFFAIWVPLLALFICMMTSLQTPIIMPEKSINWGKIEEAD